MRYRKRDNPLVLTQREQRAYEFANRHNEQLTDTDIVNKAKRMIQADDLTIVLDNQPKVVRGKARALVSAWVHVPYHTEDALGQELYE